MFYFILFFVLFTQRKIRNPTFVRHIGCEPNESNVLWIFHRHFYLKASLARLRKIVQNQRQTKQKQKDCIGWNCLKEGKSFWKIPPSTYTIGCLILHEP